MSIPSFQPQVFQKVQELPRNAVPIGSGLPVFVVSNRLGTKGFTPSGAENHWGAKNSRWQQSLVLQPNEVASDLSRSNASRGYYAENISQQHFFLPASAKPVRYAGVDYHGQYPNICIRPQFAVFTDQQAISLIAGCDLRKTGTPLNNMQPELNDSRFAWHGTFDQPMPVLRHGQTMTLHEWEQEKYQPLPGHNSPKLTVDQVVPISGPHGLPVGENPAKVPITHYCPKRQVYCTSLQHVIPLPAQVRSAYGLPGHLGNIIAAHWLPSHHEDTFEVHISKILQSDIILHKCRVSSDGQSLTFNLKKDISRFPSSPITGLSNQRKTHLCTRKFDAQHWQAVNGKANPDAEIWCFEGHKPGQLRRQHILPVSLGVARARYQSKIRPTLEKYRKMFPQIPSPQLDKPQEMQDFIRGCQLLEEGKAIHIPPHHELYDLFIPWQSGIKKFHILPLPAQPPASQIPPSYLYLLAHHDPRWLPTLQQIVPSLEEPDRTIYHTLGESLAQNKKRQ